MQPPELAQYIHEHIPLSKAIGVSVVSVADDSVILQAPLEPNLNHRHTVFGGSASALAILASWALLHVRLQSEGIADRLVIQRNVMEYQHPILGQFTARSMLERPEGWKPFTDMLARRELPEDGILVFHAVALNHQAIRNALSVQPHVQQGPAGEDRECRCAAAKYRLPVIEVWLERSLQGDGVILDGEH